MLDEKEAEITQAREIYVNEMKTTIEHSRNAIELTKKKAIEKEITELKEVYEQEMNEKEEAHFQLLMAYDEKCSAWQSEKQVTLTFISLAVYSRPKRHMNVLKTVTNHFQSLGNTFRNRTSQGRVAEISIHYPSKCRSQAK